jgi:hypothetical protein
LTIKFLEFCFKTSLLCQPFTTKLFECGIINNNGHSCEIRRFQQSLYRAFSQLLPHEGGILPKLFKKKILLLENSGIHGGPAGISRVQFPTFDLTLPEVG